MTHPRFFIVFSPDGPTPPIKIHAEHREALAIAHIMARQHPGQTFHVMKSNSRPIVSEVALSDAEGEASNG